MRREKDPSQRGYIYKNIEVVNGIEDSINLTRYKLNQDIGLHEWHFNVGKLEALVDYSSKSLKSIFKAIQESNKEIKELRDDAELFEMELEFHKGYIAGCERILNLYRTSSLDGDDLKILIYISDEVLIKLFIVMFEAIGIKYDSKLAEKASVFISNNIDELNNVSEQVDCFKLIIIHKQLQKNDTIVQIKDKSIRNRIIGYKTVLHEDMNKSPYSIDYFKDVSLLNKKWLNASYVYLDAVFNIEQVFKKILFNYTLN
jgi:hypothetical protein